MIILSATVHSFCRKNAHIQRESSTERNFYLTLFKWYSKINRKFSYYDIICLSTLFAGFPFKNSGVALNTDIHIHRHMSID